jgi:Restriction endonuclease/Clp amino terminal domain, pathogenicity island component
MLSDAGETLTLVPGMDIDAMSGAEFEAYVGGVLRHNGYLVAFTKATGDFGVDLVARRGTDVIAVQCKRRIKPVGAVAVQQVVAGAVMYQCLSTTVISNQSFTSAALALAERHKCLLIDGSELSRLAEGWHPEARKDRFAKEEESVVSGARRGTSERAMETSVLGRFSRNARVAVAMAREEADELNLDEVRPSHVLVGVLQAAGAAEPATSDRADELGALLNGYGLTAGVVRAQLVEANTSGDSSFDDDTEVLESIGIDLRAVRDSVARAFGADAFDNALCKSGRRRRRRGQIPFTRSAKKVLELALREASLHKDNEIRCEHIILGILRSGDKAAIRLLTEHVYTAHLRAAVINLMEKAA